MRRMTQAQYAAIVNRQRQIALAKQRQQMDLSDNNITNEEISDTKQKLQQEMATKKQKKATPQMTTPLPKEIPMVCSACCTRPSPATVEAELALMVTS